MRSLIAGYWVSRLIYVAARLGLADLLEKGPLTAEELAERAGVHAGALYRMMRTLASYGVFTRRERRPFQADAARHDAAVGCARVDARVRAVSDRRAGVERLGRSRVRREDRATPVRSPVRDAVLQLPGAAPGESQDLRRGDDEPVGDGEPGVRPCVPNHPAACRHPHGRGCRRGIRQPAGADPDAEPEAEGRVVRHAGRHRARAPGSPSDDRAASARGARSPAATCSRRYPPVATHTC